MRGPKDNIQVLLAAIAFVLVITFAAWLLLDFGSPPGSTRSGVAAEKPQAEFEQRVRALLLDKPEIIAEALQKLEARQQATERSEAQAVLKARSDEVFRDPASPISGNPEGDVSLVEFFDYNCPYCCQVAAKAALAAQRQGKYAAFHQALMRAKGALDEARVLGAATAVGLDVERLKSDMEDPVIQAAINRNLTLARALRIEGTPGFVIGEQIVRGAIDFDTMEGLIREARGKK